MSFLQPSLVLFVSSVVHLPEKNLPILERPNSLESR